LGNRKSYKVRRTLAWHGIVTILLLCATANARPVPRNEPTVEELKARIASANTGDKVHLCVQVAEKRLDEADKLYAASDIQKGQEALTDVVSFSEQARDYSLQSRKHQKQTEIAMRNMARKLNNILHTLGHDDQPPVQDAINRMERVRDDLLSSMFPKGAK
jgi:hypothetical protein